MAKATTTIRQTLNHKPEYGAWFAANQTLFNQVAAFYFQVIQAHELVLELGNQEAMGALEKLTHATKKNPHPVLPLSQVAEEIPAMFRRAAISAALGSARSFSAHLKKWRARKEKMQAKGKKFTERPPVPPRAWKKSATIYAGQWKERSTSSIMRKRVDRYLLVVGQVSHHWPRAARWRRSGQSATGEARSAVVAAYACGEAIQEPGQSRRANSHQRTNKNLCRRSEYGRRYSRVHGTNC